MSHFRHVFPDRKYRITHSGATLRSDRIRELESKLSVAITNYNTILQFCNQQRVVITTQAQVIQTQEDNNKGLIHKNDRLKTAAWYAETDAKKKIKDAKAALQMREAAVADLEKKVENETAALKRQHQECNAMKMAAEAVTLASDKAIYAYQKVLQEMPPEAANAAIAAITEEYESVREESRPGLAAIGRWRPAKKSRTEGVQPSVRKVVYARSFSRIEHNNKKTVFDSVASAKAVQDAKAAAAPQVAKLASMETTIFSVRTQPVALSSTAPMEKKPEGGLTLAVPSPHGSPIKARLEGGLTLAVPSPHGSPMKARLEGGLTLAQHNMIPSPHGSPMKARSQPLLNIMPPQLPTAQ